MLQQTLADPVYVMGRSEAEAQRLMLQAQLYDGITRRFLADAGLTAGMTVLDVGSPLRRRCVGGLRLVRRLAAQPAAGA